MVIVNTDFVRPSRRMVRQQAEYQNTIHAQQLLRNSNEAVAAARLAEAEAQKNGGTTLQEGQKLYGGIFGSTQAGVDARERVMNQAASGAKSVLNNPFVASASSANASGGQTMGVIEQNARARIGAAGLTGDAAEQQYQSSKAAARETMSNTGINYFNNPSAAKTAERKAARQAELDATKGYVVRYDKDGNEYYVEDAGKTAQMKEEKKAQFAAEDAANAANQNAKVQSMEQNPEQPGQMATDTPEDEEDTMSTDVSNLFSPASFLAGFDPESRQQMEEIFGPLLQSLQAKGQMAADKYNQGMEALEDDSEIDNYINTQRKWANALFERYDSLYKDQLDNQLKSAERLADQERRIVDIQKAKADAEFARAERDQMIKNEEDRKNYLTGLGVTGAWKSSRHTASVITALKKGENILADIRTDKALAELDHGNKLLTIEQNYHSNVSSAYDAYKAASLGLFEKMLNKAGELDKTVFDSDQKKKERMQELEDEYWDTISEVTGELGKNVTEAQKFMVQEGRQAKQFEQTRRNAMFNEAMQFLTKFGTQNKDLLVSYEKMLGLPAGAFTNQQTLAEIKKRGGSASGGLVGVGTMDALVSKIDAMRNRYIEAKYGPRSGMDINGEAVDKAILSNLYTIYGSSKDGLKLFQAANDYMNANPVGGSPYFVSFDQWDLFGPGEEEEDDDGPFTDE